MSFGNTWTSPRLEHATRRATSPKQSENAARITPVGESMARLRRPPPLEAASVAALPKSEALKRRPRPVSSKTVGTLTDRSAALFSSFTPDQCFPAVLSVGNPLHSRGSPMSAQLAARERRLAHRAARRHEEEDRGLCAAQLEHMRVASAAELRPQSRTSDFNATLGATAGSFEATVDHLSVTAAALGDSMFSAPADLGATQREGQQRPQSANATGNAAEAAVEAAATTVVPIFRTEAPLPRHPLSRPATAGLGKSGTRRGLTRLTSGGLRPGTAGSGRPASAHTTLTAGGGDGTASQQDVASSCGDADARFAGTLTGSAAAMALDAPPALVRPRQRPMQWTLRKAQNSPATTALGEESAMARETIALLQRGFASAPHRADTPPALRTAMSPPHDDAAPVIRDETSVVDDELAAHLATSAEQAAAGTPMDSRASPMLPTHGSSSRPLSGGYASAQRGSASRLRNTPDANAAGINVILRGTFLRPTSAPPSANAPRAASAGPSRLGDDDSSRPLRAFVA